MKFYINFNIKKVYDSFENFKYLYVQVQSFISINYNFEFQKNLKFSVCNKKNSQIVLPIASKIKVQSDLFQFLPNKIKEKDF